MKNKKRKKRSLKVPETMPEAAYNLSPDDIEIGDELLTLRELKKEEKLNKEDH
ncbi:MAG: hypothetical protein GX175_05870 [Halanaerobiaceae bacterium]|jgi:hypothetical protein|nr:hypothetical protein [Halanaerobiaceae bacterium]